MKGWISKENSTVKNKKQKKLGILGLSLFAQKSIWIRHYSIKQIERSSKELYEIKDSYSQRESEQGSYTRQKSALVIEKSLSFREWQGSIGQIT